MFTAPRRALSALILAACCAFAFYSLEACNSIYTRAGEEMPLDLRTRLATRIREARDSASEIANLIATLSPESPDLPARAESYSWEFSKAVASVHDVARRLDTRGEPLGDVLDALDRADTDLVAAVNIDETQATAALRPAFSLAADSLKAAVQQSDAYLGNRPNRRVHKSAE
jgi:hypothetical protein